jgi:hypothetical protein
LRENASLPAEESIGISLHPEARLISWYWRTQVFADFSSESLTKKKGKLMERGARSIGLFIHPASYPFARLVWAERIRDEGDRLGRRISLNRDFWNDLADICKKASGKIDDAAPQTLAIALSVISSMIMEEVQREDRREKNRETYESFLGFVVETMNRVDLDKVRKAQVIHDKASLLQILDSRSDPDYKV